ncbi:hypothetical protein ABID22_000862 [Pontibacter aydingkolensis]|uniref:HlyD family secretion protein n=1 Tax=Pontibacter aydingkolensis TaxID=1911536 RepID=A0ABS7CSR6_9BACT|nr:hypothetical protein [Pontibacter aydingkolensis]MBW7466886.1 hypothetical protein [Pontibacter aydingkolensis]
MAEINIERKKKPVWPWLLLLVIIALLAWGIYEVATENTSLDDDVAVDYVIPAGTRPMVV